MNCFGKPECVLGTHPAPPAEDRKALVDELTTTIDQIIDHFHASISTTGVDARMDAFIRYRSVCPYLGRSSWLTLPAAYSLPVEYCCERLPNV